MERFRELIIDDKITCKQIRMKDIVDNQLPIAVDSLDLSHMNFENDVLPDLSFIEVRKNFDCSNTNIRSFEGFPNTSGNIDISNTLIKSLEGCPEDVKEIEMSYIKVDSFKGCPEGVTYIDAWKTDISNFDYLPKSIKRLSIGRTLIRDLSNCPESIVDLTADYLEISRLDNLPKSLITLSISGSTVEDFKGIPKTVEEVCCYDNNNLKGLDGLNIEILKGIAIISCPNVLEEEIDAYHDIIKAHTLLQKQEILDDFLNKKETILRQKELEEERKQYI